MTHIIVGDAREALKRLPDGTVHCCVTSPPYFGLRDYGVSGQIGLEKTPSEYVGEIVRTFEEVRRVLRDDGTLWLNLGDSYAAQRSGTHQPAETLAGGKGGKTLEGGRVNRDRHDGYNPTRNASAIGLKHKDLIGIPWMVAFALREAGWYLRQDIIWAKPNPMPESVRDRCTKAHEYIFMLSKSERYYFDKEAIEEPLAASSVKRLAQPTLDQQQGSFRVPGKTNGPMKAVRAKGNRRTFRGGGVYTKGQAFDNDAVAKNDSIGNVPNERDTRNRRSVWTVATRGFKEAHFATFPPDLIEPCILAGCPEGGIVLDPFFGAGTTGVVAKAKGRQCIGVELNPAYAEMARQRIGTATLWPLNPPLLEAAE